MNNTTTLIGVSLGGIVGLFASVLLQHTFRKESDLAINFTATMAGALIGGAIAAPPIDEQLTATQTTTIR